MNTSSATHVIPDRVPPQALLLFKSNPHGLITVGNLTFRSSRGGRRIVAVHDGCTVAEYTKNGTRRHS